MLDSHQINLEKNNELQEKDVSVCFASFDDAIGPISVYHRGLADVAATEIAVKVMIGSLSLHTDNEEDLCGESIIPFPKLNKIAFSYFFTIPAPKLRGGIRSCSLIVLMDSKEQLRMYRSAPILSTQCKRLSKVIHKRYVFGKALSNNLKQKIDSLIDINSFKIEIEEFYATRKITISKSKTKGSLQFLNKVIKKDLDKAILAIILGKTVVVTGDEVMTEVAIATLELFSPHKELRKVYWTTQIVDADLIGTKSNLAKAYDDAVIVDLGKGKIIGGTSSKFCKDLLVSLKGLDEEAIMENVNARIGEIISSATTLADLAMKKDISRSDIIAAAQQFNSEKMGIIVVIAKNMNPLFSKMIASLAATIARESSTHDVFA